MEQFDFSTLIDRSEFGAAKWQRRTQEEKDEAIIPLSVADMELPIAPCIRRALARAIENIYGYTDPDARYFDAVAAWQRHRHNWDVNPEWIVCTNGVVPALNYAIRAFTNKGDGIIIQQPVYYPFSDSIRRNERTLVESPLRCGDDGYTMDFDDFETKAADPANKLFIMCSPHNPVGRVWMPEELRRIADICRRNNIFIIADEIHGDIELTRRHIPLPAAVPEAADNCIVCTSTSKTFNLAGLQLSNIIIPNDDLRRHFKRRLAIEGISNIPYFGYTATLAAYSKCEPWLDAFLDHIRGNYKLLADFLKTNFPSVRLFDLEGTYLAWMDWRCLGLTPDALADFMRNKARLILDEGTIFGAHGAGFERINLAAPRDLIALSLDRLLVAARKEGYAS